MDAEEEHGGGDEICHVSPVCRGKRAAAYYTRAMISPTLLVRLCRARDLLQEARGAVRVEQAARQAALSPYHFIRLFKATFGWTPHQVVDRGTPRSREAAAALPPICR